MKVNLKFTPFFKIERKRVPVKETTEASTSGAETNTSSKPNPFQLTLASSDSSESSYPPKKKVKRLNKFNSSWLEEPDFSSWLQKDLKMKDGHELAHCTLCSVSIIAHKSDLIRHLNSDRHKKKSLESKTIPKISNFLPATALDEKVRTAELKLVGALAEHSIPLSFMDTLGPLCRNIFSDSAIAKNTNLHRTKATAIVKNVLGNTFMEEVNEKLRTKGNFFSLIMDETTDQSSKKQCCFTAIVYNEETNKVEHLFLDMVEISSGTASGLYDCLKQMLLNKNIPIENMVGFSSDTTNVMVGEHCSVFAFLKKDLPNIALIKCSCHMIHLSSSKACLKLPRNVEDFLRSVGAHFSRSSHRQLKFQEFQEFFHVEIHKILAPAQTRWLSLKACVDRILEQYIPLKAYFTELVFSDPSKTTEEILTTMNNRFTLLYLEFMSYVLSLSTDFNTMFQAESSLLHRLKPEVEKLLKTLSSNYMAMSYIKSLNDILSAEFRNTKYLLGIEDIYIGIKASQSMEELKNDENVPRSAIMDFYKTCQDFYMELTSDIAKRFDFRDPLYTIIPIVDPTEAQKCTLKSLAPVLKRFPILEEFVTAQNLDDEWRAHAMLDFTQHGLDAGNDVESYWGKAFGLKSVTGQEMFPKLKIVIQFLLVLPFANASVERKFSDLKNIKSANRNRIHTDTIVSLMTTRDTIKKQGGSVKFIPSEKMLNCKIWQKHK